MVTVMTCAARCRHLVVGMAAVLVACSGVVACSDTGDAGASVSSSAAAATEVASSGPSAVPSVSASGSVDPQDVTPESLSDEDLGYIVTSVPEGMNTTQAEAVRGFVAFDKFTWKLWFTPAGAAPGIEGADEVMGSEVSRVVQENYDSLSAGEYSVGPVRVAILSVDVQDQYRPFTAEITVCTDQGQIRHYSGDGSDATQESHTARYEDHYVMTDFGEGAWKVTEASLLSENECVA